jgi:tetratricopeptide (TPR) repeat protein
VIPEVSRGAAGTLVAEVTRRLRDRYEQAAFGGDEAALATGMTEVTALQGAVDLARGRLLHTRFLGDHQDRPEELAAFERAAAAFRDAGEVSGEAEALFWIGCYHQAVHGANAAALPQFERAGELAVAAGDMLTLSYVERHLGYLDWDAGRTEQARSRFEESLRLRRELGFQPGVAAALLALAEFAKSQGDAAEADRYAAEARQVAEAAGARGVLRWIGQDMGD